MKKISLNKVAGLVLASGLLATSFISCTKYNDWDVDNSVNRVFSPAAITTSVDVTKVTVKWTVMPSSYVYKMQLSKDSLQFTNIIDSFTLRPSSGITIEGSTGSFVIPTVLDPKTQYSVRIMGIDTTGKNPASKWATYTFKTNSLLTEPVASDVTDEAVRVQWKNNGAAVTHIKIVKASDNSVVRNELAITSAEIDKQTKIVSGLASATSYIIYIYSGSVIRGYATYTTKAPLQGIIVDLRTITDRPTVLKDTLLSAALQNNSIILLKRGMTYNVDAQTALTKAVTIQSGDDLSVNDRAIVNITTGNGFEFPASANVSALVFNDVKLKGAGSTSNYIVAIKASNVNVGKIYINDCTVDNVRGVVRVASGNKNTVVDSVVINNSIVSNVGSYGLATQEAAAADGCKINVINVTKSTIYKAEKIITSKTDARSVLFSDCTLNEAPSLGNYLIDYSTLTTTVTNGITISNCIFGVGKSNGTNTAIKVIRALPATQITASGSYKTKDYSEAVAIADGSNILFNADAYSKNATELFVDAANANFKIKDASFAGKSSAGDPRWRL